MRIGFGVNDRHQEEGGMGMYCILAHGPHRFTTVEFHLSVGTLGRVS